MSDERFRGPNIQPGDLVSYEINGVLHTDYYRPSAPWRKRSRWQRLIRWLTPKRWRKPLHNDPLARAQAMNAKTLKLIEKLTK